MNAGGYCTHATQQDFEQLSRPLIGSAGIADNVFRPIEQDRFKTMFGVTPSVCTIAWNMVASDINIEAAAAEAGVNHQDDNDRSRSTDRIAPLHMLWALYFLKVYPKERQIASVVGRVCRKNFRNKVFIVIQKLAELQNEVVSMFF